MRSESTSSLPFATPALERSNPSRFGHPADTTEEVPSATPCDDVARRRYAAPDALLQMSSVPAHRLHVREHVTHRVHDSSEHRVGQLLQAVVNPETIPPRLYQPGPSQVREMAGCLRLRNVEALVDVADAASPVSSRSPRIRNRVRPRTPRTGLPYRSGRIRDIRLDKYSQARISSLYSRLQIQLQITQGAVPCPMSNRPFERSTARSPAP